MKPSHLYWVSQEIAYRQSVYDKDGRSFAEAADKGGAAGRGAASGDFAGAYDPLIQSCLDLWGRSVASVGGASTGFTVTANNYRAADHASDPNARGAAPRREPPHVIEKQPDYPEPASILFAGSDGDDTELSDLFDELTDLEATVIEAVMDKVKGLTRLADVYPWANAEGLDGLAETWRGAGNAAKGMGRDCNDAVSYITNSANDDWQQAMRQFTRSLWGTTAWGKNQGGFEYGHGGAQASGTSRPILEVIDATASTVATSCESIAEAARQLKREIRRIVWQAVKDTVRELLDFDVMEKLDILTDGTAKIVEIFLKKLDQEALSGAVSVYEKELRDPGPKLKEHSGDLAEAKRSAPTYRAETARAQSFGARSLREFRTQHSYAVADDSSENHYFPIDLASQEGMHGSHTIDKHVGISDTQLKQRLRDEVSPSSASSFNSLKSAQSLTQRAIDHDEDRISDWIDSVQKKAENRPNYDPNQSKIQPPIDVEFDHPTGTTVDRSDYGNGSERSVQETNAVRVVLKYKEGDEPPFVVLTSMPIRK